MLERLPEKVFEFAQLGLLGAFGGLANYVHVTMYQEQKFSWVRMIVNIFLAFYVGNLIGSMMPESTYKDGLIMAAGFCCHPILKLIEVQSKKRLDQLLDKWINRVVGSLPDKDGPEG